MLFYGSLDDVDDCIGCEKYPGIITTDNEPGGLCSSCYWAFQNEVHFGLLELEKYLTNDPHVAFAEYLRTHSN